MKSNRAILRSFWIFILCSVLIGCKPDENLDITKETLEITNDFVLYEMLAHNFGVPTDGTIFSGNEIKAVSNYSFVYNEWFFDGIVNVGNSFDSVEFTPSYDMEIGHKGFAPDGYHDFSLELDTNRINKMLSLETYRDSEKNDDYSSPFSQSFNYSGSYSYVYDGKNAELQIFDSTYGDYHLLFIDFNDSCLPDFFITNYAMNGFYSDTHTNFSCNEYFGGELFGTFLDNKLVINFILEGESSDGEILRKEVQVNAKK